METLKIYRKADISTAEARKTIKRQYKGSKIASVEVVPADADAARSAHVKVGDLVYEAVVHVAEFPPSGGDSDDGGDDSAPAPEKSDGGDDSSDSDDSDDGGDSDSGGDNPFAPKDDGGGDGGGDSGLKGDSGIIHLLTEILHTLVKGGAGADPLGGPDAGPGLDGPVPPGPGGLGDVGAPPAGGPPLPPPVKDKSPIGGPAFASVAGKTEFSVLCRDAQEIGNKAILATFAQELPTHRVSKIQRTGSAKVNGVELDLKANNFAVVTLTRK